MAERSKQKLKLIYLMQILMEKTDDWKVSERRKAELIVIR